MPFNGALRFTRGPSPLSSPTSSTGMPSVELAHRPSYSVSSRNSPTHSSRASRASHSIREVAIEPRHPDHYVTNGDSNGNGIAQESRFTEFPKANGDDHEFPLPRTNGSSLKKSSSTNGSDVLYAQFAPPTPPKTSPRFNAQDAEVTVISSDNVLFRLHKSNIRVTSGGLLSASGHDDEFVTLTEPAEILEVLFEFLYPDYETDLERAKFETLMHIAEAAEKYGVYYAMSHCMFCLRKHARTHPQELLGYAVTYRKNKLLSELTPALLDMRLDRVINILPASAFGEWCLFRERWNKLLLQCFSLMVETSLEHDDNKNYPCSKAETSYSRKLKSFLDEASQKPSALLPDRLNKTLLELEAIAGSCPYCKEAFSNFKGSILDHVQELPSTFTVELY